MDFQYVVIRGTGSDLGDDAQYYLAEAYYENEEYLEAVGEYEKLTRRMGFSPFIEDARFKICEAYRIEHPKSKPRRETFLFRNGVLVHHDRAVNPMSQARDVIISINDMFGGQSE